MRMWHDRSYLDVSDSEFVSRGYAEDDLFSVNINFEYTGEQRAENAKTAKTMTPEQWSAHCTVAVQRKSAYIFPVIEAIAQNFVCYQYEKGHGPKHESHDQVMSGIGPDSFKARYQKPDKDDPVSGWKGVAAVPWRDTFLEAQADLDRLAQERGWEVWNG